METQSSIELKRADDAIERRMQRVWNLLRGPVKLVLKSKFNFTTKVYDINTPCFVVSNHVTDLDPAMLALSFRHPVHFVASEHIFRKGFLSRLLTHFLDPIARQKGGSSTATVRMMLRKLKEGRSVALFPEGNRCWDGRTRAFSPATGKLVRSSGVTLITYKLTGGYFASPRWAESSIRRGRMTGEIVRIYTPSELKAMSADEINAAIANDIYEDAYARQQSEHIEFKGKKLAEHLETMLFICPVCGEKHTLKSSGSRFFCTHCDAESEYNEDGSFTGTFGFNTIAEWNVWQEERIKALCADADKNPIFSDSEVNVNKVITAKELQGPVYGTMTLYKDRLELPGAVIPLSELTGMSIRGAGTLYIGTADGSNYQVKSDEIINVYKYLSACTYLGCPVGLGI